jgi:hypothetical protein
MIDELSAVLDRSWSLFRAHFFALYAIGLAIWIPCEFFDAWFVAAQPFGKDFATFPLNHPASNLIGPLATCALLFYLREVDAGRPIIPVAAIKASLPFWALMVAAQITLVFVLGIAFLLLIVPGVYLFVRLAVVQTVIIAEEIDAFEAFRRSFELTKGKFWSVLLWLAAGMIPTVLLSFLMIFPMALFWQRHDWMAQGVLASVGTLPIVVLFPLVWVIYTRLEREEVR